MRWSGRVELARDTVGDAVGTEVVGDTDGEAVGEAMVGDCVGDTVGVEVVGDVDGDVVGPSPVCCCGLIVLRLRGLGVLAECRVRAGKSTLRLHSTPLISF